MDLLIARLSAPLIPDPRRRWWSAVALYAVLLLMWFVFARVTTLLLQEPRGAAVPHNKLTWSEAEWRFGTKEQGGGSVLHYLFNGTERVTLCEGSAAQCRKMLFPRSQACSEVAEGEISGLTTAEAKCNQLSGRMRYSGRLAVGYMNDQVSVVNRVEATAVRPLYYKPLIRPDRKERDRVLLTIGMLAGTVVVFYGMLRYGLPSLMRTWVTAQGRVEVLPPAKPKRARPKLVKKEVEEDDASLA